VPIVSAHFRSLQSRRDDRQRNGGGVSDLVLGSPVAVLGRDGDGAETVDGDAEHGVDGAQTDGVVDRQPQVTEHLAAMYLASEYLISVHRAPRRGASTARPTGKPCRTASTTNLSIRYQHKRIATSIIVLHKYLLTYILTHSQTWKQVGAVLRAGGRIAAVTYRTTLAHAGCTAYFAMGRELPPHSNSLSLGDPGHCL